jgi:hypothetical protein
MKVVSNTSPLTNLAAIGQFDLLRRLYKEIHIPSAVWGELMAEDGKWPGCKEVATASWVQRHKVENRLSILALRRDVDLGEAEAIVLSIELDADIILIDEKEGRHAAQRLNLKPLGVIGVLLEAKEKGFIPLVRPQLDALRETAGFWISEPLYSHAIELAREKGE